jgi:hypothetical protein
LRDPPKGVYKDCENCIVRELESKSIKVPKTPKASNTPKVSKVTSDVKKSEGIKRGPKKRSGSVESRKDEEGYSIKELSKILGKGECILQAISQGER